MTLLNYHGEGLKRPLQFIPMNLTKQVVKEKFDNTLIISTLKLIKVHSC